MTVRENQKELDLQEAIYQLINKLCTGTSPWTSWEVTRGFPEMQEDELDTAILYIELPYLIDRRQFQGSEKSKNTYEMRIGAWNSRKSGGISELAIMRSTIDALFDNPKTVHTTTFTYTTDKEYADTTLNAESIGIQDYGSIRDIDTGNVDEFRFEGILQLTF